MINANAILLFSRMEFQEHHIKELWYFDINLQSEFSLLAQTPYSSLESKIFEYKNPQEIGLR